MGIEMHHAERPLLADHAKHGERAEMVAADGQRQCARVDVRIPMKPATDSDLKPASFRTDPGSC